MSDNAELARATLEGELPLGVVEPLANPARHFTRSEVAAAIWVGAIALLVLAWQPILLGALVQRGAITDRALGTVAMLETLSLAGASAISSRLLRGPYLRLKMVAAVAALVAVDLVSGRAVSVAEVATCRAIAGLLEGFAMGATIIVLIGSANAERLNALFLAFSAVPQAAGAFLLPVWIVPKGGAIAAFDALAWSTAAMIVALPFLPTTARQVTKHATHRRLNWRPELLIGITAIFLQNAGFGAAWNYIERLAQQRGLPGQTVALAVAGNVALQVIGAFAIAWLGVRVRLRPALVAITLTQASLLALIVTGTSASIYVAASLGFGLIWLTVNSFQVRMLIGLEPGRVAAGWLVAIILLGQSIGPLLAAIVVRPGEVAPAFELGCGLLATAALAYAVACRPAAMAGLLQPAIARTG